MHKCQFPNLGESVCVVCKQWKLLMGRITLGIMQKYYQLWAKNQEAEIVFCVCPLKKVNILMPVGGRGGILKDG